MIILNNNHDLDIPQAVSKAILEPVLPTFTEALVVALKVPDDSHLTDAGLKTEALKGKGETPGGPQGGQKVSKS